ncbi:MAG: hypothetical protein PF505_04855, partial [Vallitaleaceae bacterium]|nr:hypothetical protein [Vallitaleaceae bacterium]
MGSSMYSIQVFIEIILLLAALFSILNYIVYIIFRTRQSTLMVIYTVGQILIMAIICILIYVRISSTELSSVFNFMMAVLLSYMAYFFILFAYQYFTQITFKIKRIMLLSLIPLG